MGLITRMLGLDEPKIPVHTWPKLYDFYRRDRILLSDMLDGYQLTVRQQSIAQIIPSTNKIGLSIGHDWPDGAYVYLSTETGVLPGGVTSQTAQGGAKTNTLESVAYYVIASNPPQGTIKISLTDGGTEVDLTDDGTGEIFLNEIDPDVDFWGKTRTSISGSTSRETKGLRFEWDEKMEGVGEIAEEEFAFATEESYREEMTQLAGWLTV